MKIQAAYRPHDFANVPTPDGVICGEVSTYVVLAQVPFFGELRWALAWLEGCRGARWHKNGQGAPFAAPVHLYGWDNIPETAEGYLAAIRAVANGIYAADRDDVYGLNYPRAPEAADKILLPDGSRAIVYYQSRSGFTLLLVIEDEDGYHLLVARLRQVLEMELAVWKESFGCPRGYSLGTPDSLRKAEAVLTGPPTELLWPRGRA